MPTTFILDHVKHFLESCIEEVITDPKKVVMCPGKYFTRNRKLCLTTLIAMIIT